MVIGHTGQGQGYIQSLSIFHDLGNHALDNVLNFLLIEEGGFQIHLGKLRLAIPPQILIAETFDDLIITVKSSIHQKLLGNLRTLRQGIEMTLTDPAWHQIITGPLWS